MDIPQLKELAARVRALLVKSETNINHGQALDLIASLPGLRNWPEVIAFPNRVLACEIDITSISRLNFRLHRHFGLAIPHQELLTALADNATQFVPQVWPAGPRAGVYITASPAAVDALLDIYEEATDGGVVYAERAGFHKDSAIRLDDYGLYSKGMVRVPSGTLVVVGPVQLDQQSWDASSDRILMACIDAVKAHHRVAVLVQTPTPESVCEDVMDMVFASQDDGDNFHSALVGIVTDKGELLETDRFTTIRPAPRHVPTVATTDAIPAVALEPMRKVLSENVAGIVLLGENDPKMHSAIDLVSACLALTEHAGPAARIMPRHRSSPHKDWLVPDAIRQLPFLPSIENAYARGYRRMVIDVAYTDTDTLTDYADEVMFIGGAYGPDAEDLVMRASARGARLGGDIAEHLLAALATTPISTSNGEALLTDLFIKPNVPLDGGVDLALNAAELVRATRILTWEAQLMQLLEQKMVSAHYLGQALGNAYKMVEFVEDYMKASQ